MTAIYYPDLEAQSSNGRFVLEARSPYNGTIDFPDSCPPSDRGQGGPFQRNFRYRLIEAPSGLVLWERWQKNEFSKEGSPREMFVSDEGWAIIRATVVSIRETILVISPHGQISLEVRPTAEAAPDASGTTWTPRSWCPSTAGNFWTTDSWPYFLGDHFVWRTCKGDRLVVNLPSARMLTPSEQAALDAPMAAEEARAAYSLLKDLGAHLDALRKLVDGGEQSPRHDWLKARVAIHLAGVHRINKAAGLLRAWEDLDCPSHATSSFGLPGWDVESQVFRPLTAHSLRLLGEIPLPVAKFNFVAKGTRFSFPAHPVRDAAVELNMAGDAVLNLLGAPDYVRKGSRKVDTRYEWSEAWEYDDPHTETTRRLTMKNGRLAAVDIVPAAWLDGTARAWDLLGVFN